MMEIFDNVILVKTGNTKYSCVTCFVRAGAINEKKEKKGTAHLLEHTLTAQANFGITFEAETQLEYVLFQSTQCSKDTAINLKLFKEILFETPINKDVFLKQKQRIGLELLTSYQHHMFESAYSEIFGENSGQHRGWSGTVDSIELVTFNDIRKFRERFFNRGNIVVVVSGNFNKNDVLKEITNLHLQETLPLNTNIVTVRNKIIWKRQLGEEVEGTDIFIPASTVSSYKERAVDMVFQNTLLNGSTALLENLLYKELGTVYSTETELLHWSNGGVLAFGYQTLNENIEKTNHTVESLLKDLPNRLSKERIDTAKKHSIIKFNEMLKNPELLGRWVGENTLLTDTVVTPKQFEEYIKSTTHKDIIKKAETISKMPFATL